MKQLTAAIVLLLILSLAPLATGAGTARDVVSQSADDVLGIVKNPALQDDAALETKKERLWEVVDQVFDFQRLSQYALGRWWREITPVQQEKFVHFYSLLLGKTYMNRILDYGNEKIVIGKEISLSDEVSEVRTTIFSEGTGIPVHYRLSLSEGEWRVFDVVIEGISLTKNYRSQFGKFLNRNSMDELLAVLEKKTRGVRKSR